MVALIKRWVSHGQVPTSKNNLTWTPCLRLSNSTSIRFPNNNCFRQAKHSLNDQVYFISRSKMSKKESIMLKEETETIIWEVRKVPLERMQIISQLLELPRKCTWKINSKLTTVLPAPVVPNKTAAKSRSYPFAPLSSTFLKPNPSSRSKETPTGASTEILQKATITNKNRKLSKLGTMKWLWWCFQKETRRRRG